MAYFLSDPAEIEERIRLLNDAAERAYASALPLPLEKLAEGLQHDWAAGALLPAALAVSIILGRSLWDALTGDDGRAPYEPGTDTYDPETAARFYGAWPVLVATRVLRLVTLTTAFNAGLLFDWLVRGKLFKDEEYTALRRNEPERIKLGQALSIRTDLVPEAYALELRQLQDSVPPFPSDEAYAVLEKQLGGAGRFNRVFASLSAEPVASASIGQVYKGTLRKGGTEVAVKVQRPGILAEIALDLHVLRILTPLQTVLQNTANGIKTDKEDIAAAISLVDEWGRGFVAETDYR